MQRIIKRRKSFGACVSFQVGSVKFATAIPMNVPITFRNKQATTSSFRVDNQKELARRFLHLGARRPAVALSAHGAHDVSPSMEFIRVIQPLSQSAWATAHMQGIPIGYVPAPCTRPCAPPCTRTLPFVQSRTVTPCPAPQVGASQVCELLYESLCYRT